MNCTNCGAVLAPSASFCANCGAPVAAVVAPPPPMAPPPAGPYAPPPSAPGPYYAPPSPGPVPAAAGLSIVVVVIALLLIVGLVVGLAAFWWVGSGPVPVAYGDCTAYYPSGPAYYTDVTQSDCQAFCDQIEQNTGEVVTDCVWVPR